MPRTNTGNNVFDEALQRMVSIYREGHRVVVSFSTGKDSTVLLEICIIAAEITGRLPVDVVLRDEELMFPGTYEFAERVANRPEVNMVWIVANNPIVNVYDRVNPYFWVMDPELQPSEWMREAPSWATKITEQNIDSMTHPDRFPPDPGKKLYAAIGLRTDESRYRLYGLFTSGGYITRENRHGVANVRPIYDWTNKDVWKFIKEYNLDYNRAYDVMMRNRVSLPIMRIGPPTMNPYGIETLQMASAAWPQWFDKACTRIKGLRTGVKFGLHALTPTRKYGETWEECFHRTCVDEAPQWIADRSLKAKEIYMRRHAKHASTPFPEVHPCMSCTGNTASWKKLTMSMYNGDPISSKVSFLPLVDPDFFRPGAGKWIGKPTF